MKKEDVESFIKKWLLIIAMGSGLAGFFLLDQWVHTPTTRRMIVEGVTGLLPYLLFAMLFLEFSKINPRDLFPKRWIVDSFIYQLCMGLAMIAIVVWAGLPQWTQGLWEGVLVCVFVPTATAVAVMSSKLGGNPASATTYSVLSSLFTAVMVPLLFPIVSENSDNLTFWFLFKKIFSKVFPVIIIPLLISFAMRDFTPKAHDRVVAFAKDKSYYLWSFCLAVNTAQVARIICIGFLDGWTTVFYFIFAAGICLVNFYVGKRLGALCDDRISGGQSLGQKNTILAIWIAMSFLNPTSAIVMGAYMVWQNIFNALQLAYPRLR